MTQKTALLVHIPHDILAPLMESLRTQGYRLLVTNLNGGDALQLVDGDEGVPTDARLLQDWLDGHTHTIDCMVTAASMAMEIPPARPVFYPPYHLYEFILKSMNAQGRGRIVNLYEGPGSSRGLSLPQLETVAARFDELITGSDILFNSVNIEHPQGMTPEQSKDILTQRLETIIWLATTEEPRPQMQFFRGYADPE